MNHLKLEIQGCGSIRNPEHKIEHQISLVLDYKIKGYVFRLELTRLLIIIISLH